uniref:uncharacterized protein n=1 Tax=Pristiophorus japonicus TaxID=55135 RepID=UPI00398E3AE8
MGGQDYADFKCQPWLSGQHPHLLSGERPSLSSEETAESVFFQEEVSDDDGEVEFPAGTEPLIATESDIDLTAQLVPSGGLPSHVCQTPLLVRQTPLPVRQIPLPICETTPRANTTFMYSFSPGPRAHTAGSPILSIRRTDYGITRALAGRNSSKTLSQETPGRSSGPGKSLGSSTVPFSLGTSPKPGLVDGGAGSVHGPVGWSIGGGPELTQEQGQRAPAEVPTSVMETDGNGNLTLDRRSAGILSQAHQVEGWMLGGNIGDLYCDGVDLYRSPSGKEGGRAGGAEDGDGPQRPVSAFAGTPGPCDGWVPRPAEEVSRPDPPLSESLTAGSPGGDRTSSGQEATRRRKKRQRSKQPPRPSERFIGESVALAYCRVTRELTARVLDELRRIYIKAFLENSQCFELLDSGLALSSPGREPYMDKVIVTMRDGARVGLSPAEHGSVCYYRPGVEFACVQELGNNWFRVKDQTTGQLLLLKKEMIVSDWQKRLWNFLRLEPDSVVLVPHAVICDRQGSILYVTQDTQLTGFGRLRGSTLDHRKIFKRCVRFLTFCWHHGLHPGDFSSNIVCSGESIYFDPTTLTGLEDLYTFTKSLKAAHSLLIEAGSQDLSLDWLLGMMWPSGEGGHAGCDGHRPFPADPGLSHDPIHSQSYGD